MQKLLTFQDGINFDYINNDCVFIFLHGYRGDKNEFSFLRNYIKKELKCSFLSFTYGKRNKNNEIASIKGLSREILKVILNYLEKYTFKKRYLVGYSLGAALALDLVSNNLNKFNRLILISIFDDRMSLLRSKGIIIPESENISPVKLITNLNNIHTTFIHGELDISIPIKRAYRVFKKNTKTKSKFIAISTDHYFKDKYSKSLLLKAVRKSLVI